MSDLTRRDFMGKSALALTGLLIAPTFTGCISHTDAPYMPVPLAKPDNWDPVDFNRTRGNAGAIPESYLPDINGPDGVKKHLGKHLPYSPAIDPAIVPRGFIAIMFGDPAKGYVRHPNAPASEANDWEGHWYNWIMIRKATTRWSPEVTSLYSGWPVVDPSDNGKFLPFEGAEVTKDSGKNTIYLARLPKDVQPGDTVRIWGNCLMHGEYVDFLTL